MESDGYELKVHFQIFKLVFMIPAAFDYQKVHSVDEAIAALRDGEGKILAGGHSLIPAMKLRLTRPSKLVDIAGIADLKGVHEEDGEIVIGAATTYTEITHDNLIKNHLPFFAEGAAMIGDVQIRNYGTIGGSLAHADPAADWPAMVLAAEAAMEVQGSNGKRIIKATDFFTGLFTTALQGDEIIIAVRIPIPPDGARSTYQKFRQPASHFALAGCAVMRFANGKINIAFTGVAENAFRDVEAEKAVNGKALNDASISAAVDAALQGITVLSDHYASVEYRTHLAKVYLKKALLAVA
jgi:carbon-monoxide dehydrogenase medium subunit